MTENIYKNMLFSSTATAIAEFSTLPICTIKTNFQNIHTMKSNPSIFYIAKSIYNRGGFKAFYAASFPAITGQIFSTTSKYTLYRFFETSSDYPIKNKFFNGMTAGIISSFFTHPLDVIKIHMQMNTPFNNFNILYRGYSKTFVKIAISSSIFFPLYDTVKSYINNPFISATTSGVIACIIMHPIDYLKTRHMAGLHLYDGWNPITYYRGISINLLRIVPHFIITMQTIEFMKKL